MMPPHRHQEALPHFGACCVVLCEAVGCFEAMCIDALAKLKW